MSKILNFPREFRSSFQTTGKWKRFCDLSRGIRRSVQRRRSILHPRLHLGSTADVYMYIRFICQEYQDIVPVCVRLQEIPNYTRWFIHERNRGYIRIFKIFVEQSKQLSFKSLIVTQVYTRQYARSLRNVINALT